MICSTCQKERSRGKVEKGKFICSPCLAESKKNKEKKELGEKFVKLFTLVDRVNVMVYTINRDLKELRAELANHGIYFETTYGKK